MQRLVVSYSYSFGLFIQQRLCVILVTHHTAHAHSCLNSDHFNFVFFDGSNIGLVFSIFQIIAVIFYAYILFYVA